MTPPVTWDGAPATLHFWNYVSRKTPINRSASALILHPEFVVRGPAIVTTGSSLWHHARVVGSVDQTRAALDHLGYKDAVIFRPSGRWQTNTNIYVKDRDDLFAIKIVL